MGRKIFRVGKIGVIISLLMLLVGYIGGGLFNNEILGGVFFYGLFMIFWSLPIAALGLIIWLCVMPGKRKQIGGFILLLVGLIGIIVSYLIFEAAQRSYEDMEQYIDGFFALEIGCISLVFIVMGIILFFVGINQVKNQKDQFILK
jgi:hypothetical protein